MVKIGLFGAGHLGKIHLKCLQQTQGLFEITGFYEPDADTARAVSETFGLRAFDQAEDLMARCDAIDIVSPTTTHYALAMQALEHNCHLFIEKPVTRKLQEAAELLQKSREKNRIVQVGHVERFNPALLSLEQEQVNPRFIEAHRLAGFNPRSTDVSVVLDLMIHDLDIVHFLVGAPLREIRAHGVPIVSHTADICNARLEFENGCVANLTASRISLKQMRKMRIFQSNAYLSIDFLEKKSQIVRLLDADSGAIGLPLDTPNGQKIIQISQPQAKPVNAIQMELESFAKSILHNAPIAVPLEDGYQALKTAEAIEEMIEQGE